MGSTTMIEDTGLELDPELKRRWEAVRRKLGQNSERLMTQGGLVSKVAASGRRVWAVRFVDRSGNRPVHHTIDLGFDERLIDLVRRQLDHYRRLGGFPEEVAGYARFAASARFAMRRLAARPREAEGVGA
jgi:hypothetical protein